MNDEAVRGKLERMLLRSGVWPLAVAEQAAEALLPVVREIAAEELLETADAIDRGPTFPLPPSIISALVRERADDLTEPVEEARLSRGDE